MDIASGSGPRCSFAETMARTEKAQHSLIATSGAVSRCSCKLSSQAKEKENRADPIESQSDGQSRQDDAAVSKGKMEGLALVAGRTAGGQCGIGQARRAGTGFRVRETCDVDDGDQQGLNRVSLSRSNRPSFATSLYMTDAFPQHFRNGPLEPANRLYSDQDVVAEAHAETRQRVQENRRMPRRKGKCSCVSKGLDSAAEMRATVENDIRDGIVDVGRSGRTNAVAESHGVSCAAGTCQSGFLDEVKGSRPVTAAPLRGRIYSMVEKSVPCPSISECGEE
jgi:hypothetical protein